MVRACCTHSKPFSCLILQSRADGCISVPALCLGRLEISCSGLWRRLVTALSILWSRAL